MKHTFTYREKFVFKYCYPALAFMVLAFATEILKYGIKLEQTKLLNYPNSLYILSVCAAVFALYALYKYCSAKRSSRNPYPIEISEAGLSFPKGKNSVVSVKFTDIQELWNKTDADNERQVIIYAAPNRNRYEFSEDRFDNAVEFNKFRNAMEKYCAHLAKRP